MYLFVFSHLFKSSIYTFFHSFSVVINFIGQGVNNNNKIAQHMRNVEWLIDNKGGNHFVILISVIGLWQTNCLSSYDCHVWNVVWVYL